MVAALGAWSCATVPPAVDVPAVITAPTPEGRAELVRVVSQALHGAPLTLAHDALTRESTLIVERARARGPDGTPLLGRDTGRPERFHLVRRGSGCELVHEGSERHFALSKVTCAPLATRLMQSSHDFFIPEADRALGPAATGSWAALHRLVKPH
jgi:hypothetical protein